MFFTKLVTFIFRGIAQKIVKLKKKPKTFRRQENAANFARQLIVEVISVLLVSEAGFDSNLVLLLSRQLNLRQ